MSQADPIQESNLRRPRSFRFDIRGRVTKMLINKEMGPLISKPAAEVEFSYQIGQRRMLYRVMDIVLWIMHLRHIPRECAVDECHAHAPLFPMQ